MFISRLSPTNGLLGISAELVSMAGADESGLESEGAEDGVSDLALRGAAGIREY